MTTATVDITDIEKSSADDTYVSKLNSAVGLEADIADKENSNNFYYYSSGSFDFILDREFKAETLESLSITAIPFLPEWHKGIVSIHGVIMPVIDILNFVKNQDVDVEESEVSKIYLLKLEHQDYSPIVFILDAIPRLINTENFKNKDVKNKSLSWIKNYLHNESTTLAFIDHKELFNKLINTQ